MNSDADEEWLTDEECLELIMGTTGKTYEEALELLKQFKQECPEAIKEVWLQ